MDIKVRNIDSDVEFRTTFGKDIIGKIYDIDINITKGRGICIVYHVTDDNDKEYIVDGETYQEIKK